MTPTTPSVESIHKSLVSAERCAIDIADLLIFRSSLRITDKHIYEGAKMDNNFQTFQVDAQLLQRMVDKGYARNLEEALQRAIVLFDYLSDYKEGDGSLHVVNLEGNKKRETTIMAFARGH
jgi:hypothetical protein